MRKNNSKGFTLVELIIAMSIFTVVIGMGYGMINKINISTKKQGDITSNQLNVNLINKYVTKDLEQCKTFVGPENENVGSNYEFEINEGDDPIKYMVSITLKGNKEYYTLTRKSKDSEIDLVVNQPKVSNIPFFIKEKENQDNLFTVQIDNVKEASGQYIFEVSSRLVASSGETEIPENPDPEPEPDPEPPIPEDPQDDFKEFYKVSYWVNNIDKDNVKIGVLHPGTKSGNGVIEYKDEKNVSKSSNNYYNMSLYIALANSGNHDEMILGNDKLTVGDNKFQTENLNEEANQIIVEVGAETKFEIVANETIKIPNVSSGNKTILDSGKYRFKILPDFNGYVKHFKVTGNIIKGNENAFVNIYYGKGK